MEVTTQTTPDLSEQEAIRLVLAGNTDKFEHLVKTHQERIYAVIMGLVKNNAVAKELTQDTFLKAYLSLSSFRFESSFLTWLTRIALNHTNSYFSSRRYKQHLRTVRLDMERYKQKAAERTLDTYDEDAIAKLQISVGLLTAKLREVIVLCAFEQKSYEQAATILGVPVGTVRSRLNRARNQLRELYFVKQG